MQRLAAYQEIWAVDFEFLAPSGERPLPVCMVARELRSGRTITQWQGGFTAAPPFRIDERALFVAYYASAELGCFLQLGWQKPANILDLFTEFRNLRNGLSVPAGFGLLGAQTYFGLSHMSDATKDANRDLVMRGGPWTADEQTTILDYCEEDVLSLERLLASMEPHLDMPRALLRGRYMAAAARIEWTGVPVDVESLELLRARWDNIKSELITEIDADYGVFDGTTFKLERFANYLVREDIPWPRLPSGQLDLTDDTFREQARTSPKIAPLRELRDALSKMRLSSLTVGSDGRNRTLLSAFRARTGRNQPSNAKFIFGPSAWLRSLIKPTEGNAIAYIDWSSQEFGIAAALSGDQRMLEAYTSGDPYLAFAKQSGAVPADATKASHKDIRDVYKMVVLGVGYGMEAESLAIRIGIPTLEARALLRKHKETYPRFWQWSQNAVDNTILSGRAQTVFGWNIHVGPDVNPRSLGNFPMQANGAEMLRIACCLATEQDIRLCAPGTRRGADRGTRQPDRRRGGPDARRDADGVTDCSGRF
jgi:DNA polymerase-1